MISTPFLVTTSQQREFISVLIIHEYAETRDSENCITKY